MKHRGDVSPVFFFGLAQAELVEAGFDKLSLRKSCFYWAVYSKLATRGPHLRGLLSWPS